MSEVTRILTAIEQGDPQAAERLLPLVYDELRRVAAQKMAQENPDHTLQATALVHEAYVRLVDVHQLQAWDSRRHFFAAAAEAMRRILIENARRKSRIKHGGGQARVPFGDVPMADDDRRLLDLDEALRRLASEDREAAQIVELHHFAGLSHAQAADILGITVYEARQKWSYARAWLQVALQH